MRRYMNCKGETYYGVGLFEYGRRTVPISKTLAEMRPKLRNRWLARNHHLFVETLAVPEQIRGSKKVR